MDIVNVHCGADSIVQGGTFTNGGTVNRTAYKKLTNPCCHYESARQND